MNLPERIMMSVGTTSKTVAHYEGWGRVFQELENEDLKLASYDNTLMPLVGSVANRLILDYGAGPGVLALALEKLGANVKVWDISQEMREKAAEKIGKHNVYFTLEEIPRDSFDDIICNLVLCINPEDEVRSIIRNIRNMLKNGGSAYVGFCNPLIFNIRETNLDYRFPTGNKYEENHEYRKIKKEGGYEIIESHRPIEWYEGVYQEAGLKLDGNFFTPEYSLAGNTIQDFVICRLKRE